MPTTAERNAEIAFERQQLAKAEIDLGQGRTRYENQLALVAALKSAGRNVEQAERLAELLEQTLQQWEAHRALILQRIAHLESLNRMSVPD